MEVILEVQKNEIEDEMDIPPAIFFNVVLSVIQKHLEEHIKRATVRKTWRELSITLDGKPGKSFDFLKAESQIVIKELNEAFGLEDIGAWIRTWGSGEKVEIYVRYQRS